MAILMAWAGWPRLWRGSRDIQKAALACSFAGVLAVPLYLTGGPAAGAVKGLPGFSDRILEQHQDAAGATLAVALLWELLRWRD